uniref:Uncharacterized protein n=1 Tax=Trichuris muris TaxID=70415 RepID=A0A5S6QF34_TRIMR
MPTSAVDRCAPVDWSILVVLFAPSTKGGRLVWVRAGSQVTFGAILPSHLDRCCIRLVRFHWARGPPLWGLAIGRRLAQDDWSSRRRRSEFRGAYAHAHAEEQVKSCCGKGGRCFGKGALPLFAPPSRMTAYVLALGIFALDLPRLLVSPSHLLRSFGALAAGSDKIDGISARPSTRRGLTVRFGPLLESVVVVVSLVGSH